MKYDYEKVKCLKKKKVDLYRKMWAEKEYKKKRRLELEIKIIDFKVEIEKLKQ